MGKDLRVYRPTWRLRGRVILVFLRGIPEPSNATATTKTRRAQSYTKELILYFFVILRVLCVFVVVVAVPLSLRFLPALYY